MEKARTLAQILHDGNNRDRMAAKTIDELLELVEQYRRRQNQLEDAIKTARAKCRLERGLMCPLYSEEV